MDMISHRVADLLLCPSSLLLVVQATEQVVKLGLVATLGGDADLCGRRRWRAFDTRHADLVLAELLEFDAFNMGCDV